MYPSSKATIIEAVLNVDPGSIISDTALFLISRYTPSLHLVILTIALTSPVFTSIRMATPTSPLISFNSSIKAFSAISCIPTSMVVMMSHPSTGGISTMFRYLFITFWRCVMPSCPFSIESYCNSKPFLAPSETSEYISPNVRIAKEPNGFLRWLKACSWKPPRYLLILNTGKRLASLYCI